MVKFLFDSFIDVVGFPASAAGLTGFFAQLFHALAGAPGRLELGFLTVRTWRGIAAGQNVDGLLKFSDPLCLLFNSLGLVSDPLGLVLNQGTQGTFEFGKIWAI